MNTGTTISGRPSMGSWLTYGLGSEADDLPGFVVLTSFGGRSPQPIATRHVAQRLSARAGSRGSSSTRRATPVHYLDRPAGVTARAAARRDRRGQRAQSACRTRRSHDPEIDTRIAQYEMAFRMQTSVPELMDFSRRAAGHARPVRRQAGRRLVRQQLPAGPPAGRARRAVHPALSPRLGPSRRPEALRRRLRGRVRPRRRRPWCTDLKQRGMLDDTLVIWGGEFGRTPMVQDGKGRAARPRPPHQGLLDVAGRRRHQAAASPTARPTNSATTPSKTSSTSTTCTPRCCTSWASTTSASPTAGKGAISG